MRDLVERTHHLAAPGADLYAEEVGPQDAPVVYYLHGGPGYNSHSFRDLMGDDLERYRMIYADQRGSGRSPQDDPDDPVLLDTLAHDVLTVLQALGVAQTSLLAHGFGALVAARVAHLAPAYVARLVVVGPWFDMPLLARSLQRQAAFLSGHQDEALPPESALEVPPEPDAALKQAFAWIPAKPLLDTLQFPRPASRLRLEHADAEALFGPAQESTRHGGFWQQSVRDLLTTLTLPTIILVGQQDASSYPDQVEVALERMPHALLSLFEGGHYPWLDDPETFVSVLHEALALGG